MEGTTETKFGRKVA